MAETNFSGAVAGANVWRTGGKLFPQPRLLFEKWTPHRKNHSGAGRDTLFESDGGHGTQDNTNCNNALLVFRGVRF